MDLLKLSFAALLIVFSVFAQRPLSYDLSLRIDPSQPTFTGTVRIEIELSKQARSILVHALDLTISKASADGAAAAYRPAPEEQIEIEFANPLPTGVHIVEIEYSAPLSDTSKLGPNRRRSAAGDWYAFTTFTPIEARRAFPCFDEPRFKTPFSFTIEIPQGMMAAANTPAVSESEPKAGWKTLRFARSQPIPTEVVAFTVGPWQVASGAPIGPKQIPTRILYPAKSTGSPTAALKAAPELVARLETYTGIAYPWDKLDQVALLANAYGAVENPGLITYKGEILLAKPGGVARMRGIMAHELAHQWFGNLVTQTTWQDVFLSEGFATLIGNKIADMDLPIAERGRRAAEQRNAMLERDSKPASRPVRVAKQARGDMKDIYGPEVYQKAASILRMIEVWIGEDTMRRGLQLYLTRHAGKNATASDLAAALKEVSGQDVPAVLDTFLNRSGVPKVDLDLDCKAAQPVVQVTVADGWTAPVCVRTPAGQSCKLIRGYASLPLPDATCPAWLIPNAAGAGYYRGKLKNGPSGAAPSSGPETIGLSGDAKDF